MPLVFSFCVKLCTSKMNPMNHSYIVLTFDKLLVQIFRQIINATPPHSVEITEIYSHAFLEKNRENNSFTKEITKELISQFFFK